VHLSAVERRDPRLGTVLGDQRDPRLQPGELIGIGDPLRVLEQDARRIRKLRLAGQGAASPRAPAGRRPGGEDLDALARSLPDELRFFAQALGMQIEEPAGVERAGHPHRHARAAAVAALLGVHRHQELRLADRAIGGEPRRASGGEQDIGGRGGGRPDPEIRPALRAGSPRPGSPCAGPGAERVAGAAPVLAGGAGSFADPSDRADRPRRKARWPPDRAARCVRSAGRLRSILRIGSRGGRLPRPGARAGDAGAWLRTPGPRK